MHTHTHTLYSSNSAIFFIKPSILVEVLGTLSKYAIQLIKISCLSCLSCLL